LKATIVIGFTASRTEPLIKIVMALREGLLDVA
jgi:hypothetical protein